MFALRLICCQIPDVTLLVSTRQMKVLTPLPDVYPAACMRPDPDLPSFSMAPPPRVAQAILQYLASLLSALCQRHQEARMVQSVALSASRRQRTPQQEMQQQLTSKMVAVDALAQETSHASYHEVRGRLVPAGLPLLVKLNEAGIKDLAGASVTVISTWKCTHQTSRVGNGSLSLTRVFETYRLPNLFELLLQEKSVCLGLC